MDPAFGAAKRTSRNIWARVRRFGNDARMLTAIGELEELLRERRATLPPGSYSAELFRDPERIQRKVMEEAFETCLELGRTDRDVQRIASEAADLFFHLLVGLVQSDVPFDSVLAELERRRK